MDTPEQIRERLLARFPEAAIELVANPAPGGSPSLLVDRDRARAVAEFLRDDAQLRFDYCSNATGIDWPAHNYLEAVYHLYSMARGHGPLVLRVRTANRDRGTRLPSLTPVWRSAEFQEREIFDLFGIAFEGHPDLRRILMWDDYEDHPMRKDFVLP